MKRQARVSNDISDTCNQQMSSKDIIYEELLQTTLPKRKMDKRLAQALYNGGFPNRNVLDLISQNDIFILSNIKVNEN